MARHTLVFVGPYASWLVAEGEWPARRQRDEALAVDILDGPALAWAGIDWKAVVAGTRGSGHSTGSLGRRAPVPRNNRSYSGRTRAATSSRSPCRRTGPNWTERPQSGGSGR